MVPARQAEHTRWGGPAAEDRIPSTSAARCRGSGRQTWRALPGGPGNPPGPSQIAQKRRGAMSRFFTGGGSFFRFFTEGSSLEGERSGCSGPAGGQLGEHAAQEGSQAQDNTLRRRGSYSAGPGPSQIAQKRGWQHTPHSPHRRGAMGTGHVALQRVSPERERAFFHFWDVGPDSCYTYNRRPGGFER